MSTEPSMPDFDQLARETPWPREEWRRAWSALPRTDTWPSVVKLVAHRLTDGRGPEATATALARALEVEPIRRAGIDDDWPKGEEIREGWRILRSREFWRAFRAYWSGEAVAGRMEAWAERQKRRP